MLTHPTLSKLPTQGRLVGPERLAAFMQTIGEPQLGYPCVHIGGTNGKGSTCTYVAAILKEAGYTTGSTFSPHLETLAERIQINGVHLDIPSFKEVLETLERAHESWCRSRGRGMGQLTYFEFLIAAALLVFAQRQVDVAVVEVGLGGRHDATNILQPLVTAITSIGVDHAEYLGTDIAGIAREKAGIFKAGVPVVIGPMPVRARDELIRIAKAKRAPVWRPGPELRREFRKGKWNLAVPGLVLTNVELGLRGEHQGANAVVALGVVAALRNQGFVIPEEAIRRGFKTAFIPGRLEQLRPALLIDGAHNEDGAKTLARYLESQPRPANRILLWGMGHDRDPSTVIKPLLPHFDEIVTTRCAHPKAWDPVELALHLRDLDAVLSAGSHIEETLPEVYAEADETVVAGSLYLAGAARSLNRSGALDGIVPGQGPAEDPLEELDLP